MNTIKRFLAVLMLASLPILSSAQNSLIRPRLEIAEVEVNDGDKTLSVFKMADESPIQYYLSVGKLGVGDDFIQLQIDPVSELFIPLGESVSEVLEKLEMMKELYKGPADTSIEIPGCLSIAYPNDSLEPVTVTYRKVLLSNMLEFSIKRGEWTRATYIPKSTFSSLITSAKFYGKLHPKE